MTKHVFLFAKNFICPGTRCPLLTEFAGGNVLISLPRVTQLIFAIGEIARSQRKSRGNNALDEWTKNRGNDPLKKKKVTIVRVADSRCGHFFLFPKFCLQIPAKRFFF